MNDKQRVDTIQKLIDEHSGKFVQDKELPNLAFGLSVRGERFTYFHGASISNESQFRIASMTKSFTAMAVMKLAEDGLIDLYSPIKEYLPTLEFSLGDDIVENVSVHDLLSMQSGLNTDDPWADRNMGISKPDFMVLLNSGLKLTFYPGERFTNSNLGYGILGQLIETVSGQEFDAYISESVIVPAGLTGTVWENPNSGVVGHRTDSKTITEDLIAHGAWSAMGGLWSTVQDLLTWTELFLSSNLDSNTQDFNRSQLLLQQQPKSHNKNYYRDPSRSGDNNGYGYSYGLFWGQVHDESCVAHSGGLPGYGSRMVWYPRLGVSIVAMSASTYAPVWDLCNLVFATLQDNCLLYTSPSPRDQRGARMPSSA